MKTARWMSVGQTVTVTNVAPTVTAAADQTADRSSPTSFALGSFADPGDDGPWSVQVEWGDGSTSDTFSLASPGELESLSHSYAVADVYMVTVTVSEKNGAGESGSASFEVTVASLEAGHSISGYVYADVNNNGIRDAVEMGLPNVPLALTGSEQRTVLSGPDGHYVFSQLPPGTYHVRETQPLAFLDGIDTPGTPLLGGAENDYFHDVQLSGEATLATGYNFGERGLRPDLVSKQLLLASTPPYGELISRLDVVGGTGWGTFTADYYATLTLTAESESGEDVTLQVYDQAMLPVSLARGSWLQVGVVEGEGYLIHVSGTDTVRFEFTIDQSGTYTNQSMPLDVTVNGAISPLDALMIINRLNGTGRGAYREPNSAAPYYDTNADLVVSPLDALRVVNWLNQGGSSAEGESSGPTQENNHGASGPLTVAALLNDSTSRPSLNDQRNFQTEGLTVAAAVSDHATASVAPAMTFSRPSDRHELSETRAAQRALFGSGSLFFAGGFHAIQGGSASLRNERATLLQAGGDHTHRGQGSSESFGGSGVPVMPGASAGTQRVGDARGSHSVMSDQAFGSHQHQSGTDTSELVAGPLDNEALYETIAIDLLEGRQCPRPDPGPRYAAVDILLLEDDWLD